MTKTKKILLLFFFSLFVFDYSAVYAHSGRTDASGCHTCRTNCYNWGLSNGEYHCHRAKSLPQPLEPVTSHYSDTGGYTESEPEYKNPTPTTINTTNYTEPASTVTETNENSPDLFEERMEKIYKSYNRTKDTSTNESDNFLGWLILLGTPTAGIAYYIGKKNKK